MKKPPILSSHQIARNCFMQLLTNLFLACLKSKSWIGWFVKSLPENGAYHYDLSKKMASSETLFMAELGQPGSSVAVAASMAQIFETSAKAKRDLRK